MNKKNLLITSVAISVPLSLFVGSVTSAAETGPAQSNSVEQSAPGAAAEATDQATKPGSPDVKRGHSLAIKLTPEVVKAGNPVNVVISGLDYGQEVDLEITGPQNFTRQVHLGRFQPPMKAPDLHETLPTYQDQHAGVYTVTLKGTGVSATFKIAETRKGEPEFAPPKPEGEVKPEAPEAPQADRSVLRVDREQVETGKKIGFTAEGLDSGEKVKLKVARKGGDGQRLYQIDMGRVPYGSGTVSTEWLVPTDLAPGDYTATIERHEQVPAATVTFTVFTTRKGEPEFAPPKPEGEVKPEAPETPKPEAPKPESPKPEAPKPESPGNSTPPQSQGKADDSAAGNTAKPAPKAPLARTGVSVPTLAGAGLVLLLGAGSALALRYRRRLSVQD